MEELTTILKQQIIDALNLEDMTPADIDNDAPLFGNEGLGLDSIDALELIVLLEKEYGIKLENPSKGKEVFRSVDVMAKFVSENRNKLWRDIYGRADIHNRCRNSFSHRSGQV